MGWRLEAFKAAISGRPDRMQQFFTSRMTSPPDRNTQEFLATYARSPRLSPVTKIATDLSNVPGKLFRVAANGDKDEITDHPFLDFMARPNPLPFMTRSALWKVHETYLMIKGEGAAIIERDAAGYPVELWPIPPHWMTDIPRLDFPYYIIRSRDGLQMTVPIEDVFLVRQLNPLDPYGRGLGDAEAVRRDRDRRVHGEVGEEVLLERRHTARPYVGPRHHAGRIQPLQGGLGRSAPRRRQRAQDGDHPP